MAPARSCSRQRSFWAASPRWCPPPRVHQVRYHGAFAPGARGRAALTGKPRASPTPGLSPPDPSAPVVPPASTQGRQPDEAGARPSLRAPLVPPATEPNTRGSRRDDDEAPLGAPPPRPARKRYLPWAELLRRVHQIDVLVCARCHGPLRVLAFLTDPVVTAQILRHLGLPAAPPAQGLGLRRRGGVAKK